MGPDHSDSDDGDSVDDDYDDDDRGDGHNETGQRNGRQGKAMWFYAPHIMTAPE